MEENFQ